MRASHGRRKRTSARTHTKKGGNTPATATKKVFFRRVSNFFWPDGGVMFSLRRRYRLPPFAVSTVEKKETAKKIQKKKALSPVFFPFNPDPIIVPYFFSSSFLFFFPRRKILFALLSLLPLRCLLVYGGRRRERDGGQTTLNTSPTKREKKERKRCLSLLFLSSPIP